MLCGTGSMPVLDCSLVVNSPQSAQRARRNTKGPLLPGKTLRLRSDEGHDGEMRHGHVHTALCALFVHLVFFVVSSAPERIVECPRRKACFRAWDVTLLDDLCTVMCLLRRAAWVSQRPALPHPPPRGEGTVWHARHVAMCGEK